MPGVIAWSDNYSNKFYNLYLYFLVDLNYYILILYIFDIDN